MRIIRKYFKSLSNTQIEQFNQLYELYLSKNQQVNVISRKDVQHIYLHHVLHSLSIAKKIHFPDGTKLLDLGTGGGFPGIPLAIYFPNCTFILIDGTKKKIRIVEEVCAELGLKNVKAFAQRAEEHRGKYDYVLSRAVAKIAVLWDWALPLLNGKSHNGLITLKGGNVEDELKALPKNLDSDITFINSLFQESYFEEKFIVHVHRRFRK